MALTKWTNALRANFRSHDGHMTLISVLKHAAFTEDQKVLLVHAGFDPSRPLSAQADSFWWGGKLWDELDKDSRHPFQMILRGSDRRRSELPESERKFDGRTLTLDGGCGFGGPLIAACIAPNGSLLEVIEA